MHGKWFKKFNIGNFNEWQSKRCNAMKNNPMSTMISIPFSNKHATHPPQASPAWANPWDPNAY